MPNMYRAIAPKPGYLEAHWNEIKTVTKGPGKLDADQPDPDSQGGFSFLVVVVSTRYSHETCLTKLPLVSLRSWLHKEH